MHSSEYDRFSNALYDLADVYGAKLSQGAVNLYWEALQAYPFEAVQRAIRSHAQDPDKGRYMPRPADLIARLGQPSAARGPSSCSYVRPADGRPCRNAGTMSESITGSGPYYCRAHFPATSEPSFWDAAVEDSYHPYPPTPNWRDATVDKLIQDRGLSRQPGESGGAYRARMLTEWRALKPALLTAVTRRPDALLPANERSLTAEEQDRLLAAARARYRAGPADSGPVWTPPIEEENPV